MDMRYQDLQWVIDRSTKEFKDNKHRRVSSLFRDLRKNKSYTFIGDYSLLWAIAKSMDSVKIKRVRKQFWGACRYSKEFREATGTERRWWLNTLVGSLG